jgi:hypothetical protein
MDDDERAYAEYLNDLYGDVEICGNEYPSGQALYDVDPIAFRVAMADSEMFNGDEEDDDNA